MKKRGEHGVKTSLPFIPILIVGCGCIAIIIVVLLLVGLILFSAVGKNLGLFESAKTLTSKISIGDFTAQSLPTGGGIDGYIQSQLKDIDKDGRKEAIVISYTERDSGKSIDPLFAIYKKEGNEWIKVAYQRLESFTLSDTTQSPQDRGKDASKFSFVSVTGNNADILVETRAEGSGQYFGAFLYGLTNGSITELWQHGPVPHGAVGMEEKQLWFVEPIYGPDDPNCCPSEWEKIWWQWNGVMVDKLGERTFFTLDEAKQTRFGGTPPAKEERFTGTIEGSLSYPSDYIPTDMEVCAEDVATKETVCTNKHVKSKKYTYGEGYTLAIPAGKTHYVYAKTSALPGYKAYFSEAVICGLTSSCKDHTPATILVNAGSTISNVDPIDWYK